MTALAEALPVSDTTAITHLEHSPIFVVGHGSSGTSLLTILLREHFGIAFGTESQFIIRYFRQLERYGDLSRDTNLRKLIEHLLTERWFERSAKFGFRTNLDAILRRVRERTYSGVLEAIFSEFATQVGLVRWGDKTPAYNYDLPVIEQLFPDAKYIHMVRDGRDVAVSVMRRYWGHKNIYLCAKSWRDQLERVDRFLESVTENRVLEVRYEDLLAGPAVEIDRLAEFLAIDNFDEALRERIKTQICPQLNSANFGKWRKQWSMAQRCHFERLGCETLRRHGYETVVDVPIDDVKTIEKVFWRIDNKLRKWSYPEYWMDNAYKLRLRSRQLIRR